MRTHSSWYLTFWARLKVTSLTLGWKCYLHFVLLIIPVHLICYMTMFEKKSLIPLVPPSAPKSHPWGMAQATEYKSRLICFVSFICENTHKIWYKNLWNWHGNRNFMIFDLWPHPKVTSLTLRWKFYLHSVLLVIPVNLIYHMTMFEKNFVWPPGHPQSPTPGAWPRGQNENPVWYVLYL